MERLKKLTYGMVICLMVCIGVWTAPREKIIAVETGGEHENIYLEANSTSFNVGDEVIVKLYAKNLKVATLTGCLVYDKDVFDEFRAEDFISPSYLESPWSVSYSRQTGGFVLCNSEGEYISLGDDCILEMRFIIKKAVSSSTIKILGVELDSISDYIEGGNISVTVGKQSDGATTEGSDTATNQVKDYTEVAEGFYLDYNYTQPVSKSAVAIYANGTKNYKSEVLYTDITPSYVYSEEKGKIKTSTSKIVAAVTSSDKEPTIAKGKIITTKADTNIAKATIKNGQITLTAGKNGGIGYLWVANVISSDKAKKMISIPVNVKVAPTKIETYSTTDKNVTLGTTPKYTAGELQLMEKTYVYLYPYAKVNNTNTETTDSITFTATVAKNASDYIKVEKTEDPFVFIVAGYALKNGKKVSGNVTFTCNQSGKKVNFKATVIPVSQSTVQK